MAPFDPHDLEVTGLGDAPPAPVRAPREAPPPPRSPAPPKHGAKWWACVTEACSHQGYVATASGEREQVTRRRCRTCHGIAIQPGTEDPCEDCDGVGAVITKKTVPAAPECPWCRADMAFVSQGAQPQGYPRMETPHHETDDGPHRGEVAFGRTRIVE